MLGFVENVSATATFGDAEVVEQIRFAANADLAAEGALLYVTPEGHWLPIVAGGSERRLVAAIPVTRYRYRGNTIPNPYLSFEQA